MLQIASSLLDQQFAGSNISPGYAQMDSIRLGKCLVLFLYFLF